MIFEDIKLYLPKYLSSESDKELFEGLKDFPANLDSRMYTTFLQDEKTIFQGDALSNLSIFNLPSTELKNGNCIVLSNTCDIDLNNTRFIPSQIVYAPILNLNKYRNKLLEIGFKPEQVNSHINSIKKQEITQVFYLPSIDNIFEESLVYLDRVINCPNNIIDREKLPENRIFSLSDYGTFLFLFKLSIHFTRIKDRVERRSVRL